MKIALLQLCSSDDPEENLQSLDPMIRAAAAAGAVMVLTPEVTNCVSLSRVRQADVLYAESDDPMLAALCALARDLGIWISIGSLALLTDDPDGRFANRSFLIDDLGQIRARYDKIHMFDVQIDAAETFRESDGYRPGNLAVLADGPGLRVGLSICYDLRFPQLYRRLAQAGAEMILVPSAFSPVTGAAHWEALLRARAIETGCYVVAAAQTGEHAAKQGARRRTYGHSMVVDPWGNVLLDAGTKVGISFAEIDSDTVPASRARIPSLTHDRDFGGPD